MSFRDSLYAGWSKPTRYREGEAINVWGAELGRLADQLDDMDLPREATEVIGDLFEEIGQQMHDLNEIAAAGRR